MNPTESRPGFAVMHGSVLMRQRTASKLFVALCDTNTEQDSQVAQDLPCEEHPRRQWQTAGKLGRATGALAPARQRERQGLQAMHTPKCRCQPRAVCSLRSLMGLESLQRCRRGGPGANASCTAQGQTHRSHVFLLRAAYSSFSLECHQQRSGCPSLGGGDSG